MLTLYIIDLTAVHGNPAFRPIKWSSPTSKNKLRLQTWNPTETTDGMLRS